MNLPRPRRPGRFRLALLVLILATATSACQASATPPNPTALPTPTVPAVSPATPSPTPASTGIPAEEVNGSPGALAAGRYTHGGFEPRITFELDGPWHAVNAFHGFFDVQQDVGSPDVIAVQFGLPDQVYTAPGRSAAITGAEATASALESNHRLVVLESSSSKIGGLTGYQVTVENPATTVGDAQVLHLSPGALSISPGRRLRCAFFDTPQGVLAILVGGSVATWQAALDAAEPVLESVTIGR